MTTLEGTVVQANLARALANGCETMVTEASSEGLAQHRLDGTEFDVAVFTNLSRDHLDFHGSMENYLAAKGLLFMLAARSPYKGFGKAAIINGDDRSTDYFNGLTSLDTVTYGLNGNYDVRATEVVTEGFGLRFNVHCDGIDTAAQVPLIGRFNVYNSLIAIAVARSQGVDSAEAVAALATFPGVPGRLERIECGQPFSVYVDIASTPAALENVLNALRPGTKGRIRVVFGAAGGRDPARRDGMGRVAGRSRRRLRAHERRPPRRGPGRDHRRNRVRAARERRCRGRDLLPQAGPRGGDRVCLQQRARRRHGAPRRQGDGDDDDFRRAAHPLGRARYGAAAARSLSQRRRTTGATGRAVMFAAVRPLMPTARAHPYVLAPGFRLIASQSPFSFRPTTSTRGAAGDLADRDVAVIRPQLEHEDPVRAVHRHDDRGQGRHDLDPCGVEAGDRAGVLSAPPWAGAAASIRGSTVEGW